MTKNQIFMLAAIALTIAMIVWRLISRAREKKVTNELTAAMLAGDFERFDALADDPATKRIIYPFNLAYAKLNSYLMRNDTDRAVASFDELRDYRLNDAQKLELGQMGFNFFISQNDHQRAVYYHDLVNSVSGNQAVKDSVNIIYEIVVEKKTDRLQQLLDLNEKLDDMRRSSNEYLISEIYGNMGDEKNRQKYERLAKKHLESYERMLSGRK
ncbi:MAG: hypothetical protein J5694_03360 [Erysipelotrichaceae bacterium]|nr:hypothetical protein [Erysipelotrichaceae bacterium]MBO4537887.1 hypothetical protein [Erysipelotrichaceae bacterium]